MGGKVSFLKMVFLVPLKICSILPLGSVLSSHWMEYLSFFPLDGILIFLPIGWNTYLSYLWEENPLIVTPVENQLTNNKTWINRRIKKILSLCHKLWFSNVYIFAFQCQRSLKYKRFTQLGCKDIRIRKFEFVTKTQFILKLWEKNLLILAIFFNLKIVCE